MTPGPLKTLHPRALLLAFLYVSIYTTVSQHVESLLLVGAGLVCLLIASRPGPKSFRLLFWLNLLGIPGSFCFFLVAGWEVERTLGGAIGWALHPAALYALRLECLIIANLVLVSTIGPRALFALGPRWLPSGFRTLLVTALRFIPLTMNEAIRICQVQRCRGLKLRIWSPRTWVPIVIPLFLAQMRRAHETALMLTVRGIMPGTVSLTEHQRFRPADWLVLSGAAGVFLVQITPLVIPIT